YPENQLHNWSIYEFAFPLCSDDEDDVFWKVNESYCAKLGLGEGPDYSFLKASDFFFVTIGSLPAVTLESSKVAILILLFFSCFVIPFGYRAFHRAEPLEDAVYATSIVPATALWYFLTEPRVFHVYRDYAAILSFTLLAAMWLAAEVRDVVEHQLIAMGKIRKKLSRKGLPYLLGNIAVSFTILTVVSSVSPDINPTQQYGTVPYFGSVYFPDLQFTSAPSSLVGTFRVLATLIVVIAIVPPILDVKGEKRPLFVVLIWTSLFILPFAYLGWIWDPQDWGIVTAALTIGLFVLFISITQSVDAVYEGTSSSTGKQASDGEGEGQEGGGLGGKVPNGPATGTDSPATHFTAPEPPAMSTGTKVGLEDFFSKYISEVLGEIPAVDGIESARADVGWKISFVVSGEARAFVSRRVGPDLVLAMLEELPGRDPIIVRNLTLPIADFLEAGPNQIVRTNETKLLEMLKRFVRAEDIPGPGVSQ
ncbi:MAG: hypothetical protein ACTSU5_07050, partial [Promethearchaeota archaeon]